MKRILSLLLSFVLIVMITACSGNTAADSSKPEDEGSVETMEEQKQNVSETTEKSEQVVSEAPEESVASSLTFDKTYTDDAGRVYTTYTAKELVEKIVAMDEAGVDLFNDVSELAPDGFIQIPIHLQYAGKGSKAASHDTETFMLIKDYRELNGEPGYLMECTMLKNYTDSGIDALSAMVGVYFYDNEAPENKAYAGSALQEKLTQIITASEDPYQSFLLRCKVAELCASRTSINGEKAAHGYSCIFYVTDIVPIG